MVRMTTNGWLLDPLKDMLRFERDMDNLFWGSGGSRASSTPPINVYSGEDDVVVTSEIPGIKAEDVEISVSGDTLTMKGTRKAEDLAQGATWHRRERGEGSFYRRVRLPFSVDSQKVEAAYEKGVLRITLPRSEADKPRKISVRTSE